LIRRDALIGEELLQIPVLYELAADHPAHPPVVIAGRTDLFNPHVHDVDDGCGLPPLAFICLGAFSPTMTVADLVVATFRVLAWARIAADHPFNAAAAAWARLEMTSGRFPIDRRGFFDAGSAALRLGAAPIAGTAAQGLRLV